MSFNLVRVSLGGQEANFVLEDEVEKNLDGRTEKTDDDDDDDDDDGHEDHQNMFSFLLNTNLLFSIGCQTSFMSFQVGITL